MFQLKTEPLSVTPKRYAAIDIGTVTCRLLIADVDKDGLHERERSYGITNLGEGVDATGFLLPEAMQRVAEQIKLFQAMIEAHTNADFPSIATTVMATSASRDAKNSDDFFAILAKLGVELSIIPGTREAALVFAGVSNDFRHENLLVVDVGGGSTELIAGYAGSDPALSHSYNVGCRRLTERYLLSDPPTTEELEKARLWVIELVSDYFGKLAEGNFCIERVVAVAGTATSIVSMHERMLSYDSSRVHGSLVSRAMLQALYHELKAKPLEERRKTVGLEPDRANVIVAGLLILDTVMEIGGQEFFTVSESDILQGIILDTAAK